MHGVARPIFVRLAVLLRPVTRTPNHGRCIAAVNSWVRILPSQTLTTIAVTKTTQRETSIKCNGCGSALQTSAPHLHGYLPEDKYPSATDKMPNSHIICQRCTYLKDHNTVILPSTTPPINPFNISQFTDHIKSFSTKRALILVIIDAMDFPGSLFPNLDSIVSTNANPLAVHIVANKVDLLPHTNQRTLQRLEKYIRTETLKGTRFDIGKTWFTSSKTGQGIGGLSDWIVRSWGNRGDVYLLGCTNVGKSSLFHKLMIQLCGSLPGDNETVSGLPAPSPVVSCWPGTTLDLISFPILSLGKRRRLLSQISKTLPSNHEVFDKSEGRRIRDLAIAKRKSSLSTAANPGVYDCLPDIEDVLVDIGLRQRTPTIKQDPTPPTTSNDQAPMNRRWLHDTPGAIIDTRLINFLTTKELQIILPKQPLRPRTFILKPGSTLFIGGLARLDYHEGAVSAYFTVFCSSSIPLHTSLIHKADSLYERNLGKPLLKIPFGDQARLNDFPSLQPHTFNISGCGLHQCASDIILSSIGWASVTLSHSHTATINTFTTNGEGVWLRHPALVPDAIKERGRRSKQGNRTAFTGKK